MRSNPSSPLEAVSTSEDDFATEAFKREQFASGGIVSTQSGISAGHAQLAASYGLDPVEYSVAELVIIAGENDEQERDRFIAAYAGDDGAVISSQGSGKAHVAKAVELFDVIDAVSVEVTWHRGDDRFGGQIVPHSKRRYRGVVRVDQNT